MEEPPWKALSPTAQALYPWLKLEWHGPKYNNNGKIRLSVRQAAERLGVSRNTAARAFQDLQAKGFLHITETARLGLTGEARSSKYELTEIAMPTAQNGRKLYRAWRAGHDFPVQTALVNNPSGRNGKTEPCHQNRDATVINMTTYEKGTSSI